MSSIVSETIYKFAYTCIIGEGGDTFLRGTAVKISIYIMYNDIDACLIKHLLVSPRYAFYLRMSRVECEVVDFSGLIL